jgi:hypothetical protein
MFRLRSAVQLISIVIPSSGEVDRRAEDATLPRTFVLSWFIDHEEERRRD